MRQSNSNKLFCQLLGRFTVFYENKSVSLELKGAKQVLAWLALKDGHEETRHRLAAVIWPDKDDERARSNLRQALFHLRKNFQLAGYNGLETNRLTVKLNGIVETDLEAIIDRIDCSDTLARLAKPPPVCEEMLAEFIGTNDLYTDWVSLRRMDFQQKVQLALKKMLDKIDKTELAVEAARSLLAQDPGDEHACRRLMELSLQMGETSEALRSYATLWAYLKEEFDVEPSDRTQDLAVQIKMGTPEQRQNTRAQAELNDKQQPSELSLATRPYVEIAESELGAVEPSMQPIIKAFRGELMSRLSKFREWRVRDGEAATKPVVQSSYLITSVAVQLGDAVQVTLTLINCNTRDVIWSETFVNIASQWSEILVEIASQVSAVANISISRERLMEITGQEASSVRGFDAWLLGQRLLAKISQENWQKAETLLRGVVEKEPNFTRAYTCLARLFNTRHLAFPGRQRDPADFAESLELSNAAIASDPLDCQAHLCRAWSVTMRGDYEQGADAFDTARNLNPHDPWTVLSSALGAAFCGDTDLAMELAARSLQMGWTTMPLHWSYHATIRFLCGDYEGCVAASTQAGDVFYNLPAWHAAALVQLQRPEEAKKLMAKLIERCVEGWAGETPANSISVIDWVTTSFPIKQSATQDLFRRSVMQALGGGEVHQLHAL